jgi:hypothetical protein
MIAVAPPTPPAELRGTARQVAYATTIRTRFLVEIDELRDRAADRLRFGIVSERDSAGLDAIVRAADAVCRVDQAHWWIRQDGRSVQSILTEIGRRIVAMDEERV